MTIRNPQECLEKFKAALKVVLSQLNEHCMLDESFNANTLVIHKQGPHLLGWNFGLETGMWRSLYHQGEEPGRQGRKEEFNELALAARRLFIQESCFKIWRPAVHVAKTDLESLFLIKNMYESYSDKTDQSSVTFTLLTGDNTPQKGPHRTVELTFQSSDRFDESKMFEGCYYLRIEINPH